MARSQADSPVLPPLVKTSDGSSRARAIRGAMLGLAALAAGYCFFGLMQFRPLEFIRAAGGLVLLWLPAGAVFYLLLERDCADRLERLTLSASAAYMLTTLLYFAFAVLHAEGLFYVFEAALLMLAAAIALRRGSLRQIGMPGLRRVAGRIDAMLLLIIAGSLLACARYSRYSEPNDDGGVTLTTYGDSTYFTSLAYELGRHVPPLQSSTRAGLPERAYHNFPHLTAMLIGRYTAQPDLLRANFVYRHTCIEILICLGLYCVGRRLTGSRSAGLVGVSLMYVFAVPTPPIMGNGLDYYYFTLYPHVSSFLQPVSLTSSQMYGSVAMVYALFAGVLVLLGNVRQRRRAGLLPLLLGAMAGAMVRFRVQVFLPLLPAFLVLMAYLWLRTRETAFAAGAAAAAIVAGLLLLEMRRSCYLPATANLHIGYNGLTKDMKSWMNSWPLARQVHRGLILLLGRGRLFTWCWQIVSVAMVSLLNLCGLPLLAGIAAYLRTHRARSELLPFTLFVGWLFAASIVGAILLTTSYDSYSVGGQMLLNLYVYGFPLLGVAVWRFFVFLRGCAPLTPATWNALTGAMAAAAMAAHFVLPPTPLEKLIRKSYAISFTDKQMAAFLFLRDQTPPDSVIASNMIFGLYHACYSGIGGRACYFEYLPAGAETLPTGEPPKARPKLIFDLWNATSPAEFEKLLARTPITHLVEFGEMPLHLHEPLLRKVWEAGDGESRVTIWHVANRG